MADNPPPKPSHPTAPTAADELPEPLPEDQLGAPERPEAPGRKPLFGT